MKTLIGKTVLLRALEPEDLDYLFEVENDESLWYVSTTLSPYSRHLLKQYIDHSHLDIYEAKQLRLVICEKTSGNAVGLIDLFDYDPKNRRLGIGILIYPKQEQRKGYALEALQLALDYGHHHLEIHQIYAGVTEDNEASIALFEKAGFTKTGIKKEWTRAEGKFKDELTYQYIYGTASRN